MDREILGRKVIKDRAEKLGRPRRPRVLRAGGGGGAGSPTASAAAAVTPSSLWQNGVWISSFPDEAASMSQTDFSPGFALRKIALLFENRKWEDCAELVRRLGLLTLRTIVPELPVDVIIDAVPASLPILEALYARLFVPGDPDAFPAQHLRPDQLIGKVVRWLVALHDHRAPKQTNSEDYYTPMVQCILTVIVRVNPRLRSQLRDKRASLGRCVDGLASHGLVDTSDTKLRNLHEALRGELSGMMQQLRSAVQKLEELQSAAQRGGGVAQSLSRATSASTAATGPSGSSHHRLLHFTQLDVQERLIKNKTLYNVVEPALSNKYLAGLVATLDRRIQLDKQVLFHFTELRKEVGDLPQNTVVSSMFLSYRDAYSRVEEMVSSVCGGVGVDSAAEMSRACSVPDITRTGMPGALGDVPAQSMPNLLEAENNNYSNKRRGSPTLENGYRGVTPPPRAGLQNGLSGDTEDALRAEVALLRQELSKCRDTIKSLQEREKSLRDRISEQAQRQLKKSSKFEDLSLGENRPTELCRRYSNLYSQTRVDAYDALDDLPEMAEFDDLKGKLLFSVVVLSFRSAQQTLRQIRGKTRRLLYLSDTATDPVAAEMEETIDAYLRRSLTKYDISANVQEVSSQVFATLYDYPSLKTCSGLVTYIRECVTLSWALSVQTPPVVIDYDARVFQEDRHSRFHTSDPDSNQIQSILWPALLEGENGHCLSKGIVVT